jgi:hypothetical protein
MSRYSFSYLLSYPHVAEWTLFQTHYFSENLVTPGIDRGTSGSVARNSDYQTTEAVGHYNAKEIKLITTVSIALINMRQASKTLSKRFQHWNNNNIRLRYVTIGVEISQSV